MSTIALTKGRITVITVFTVEPAAVDDLLRLAGDIVHTHLRKQPGFISANFHRGLDGRHVVNYAQWENVDAIERFNRVPEVRQAFAEMARISSAAPGLYEVVEVIESDDPDATIRPGPTALDPG